MTLFAILKHTTKNEFLRISFLDETAVMIKVYVTGKKKGFVGEVKKEEEMERGTKNQGRRSHQCHWRDSQPHRDRTCQMWTF